jgi:tripartite-type tricarboxylate transporter receptor subunit TctC
MTRTIALALFALLGLSPAAAQDWPTKSIRFIVPFGAGSTPDMVARLIADHLQHKHGMPFVIENKPGASRLRSTRFCSQRCRMIRRKTSR